jgi:hypothetical protein
MSEIKRLFARMKRELGLSRECLSTDMLNEIGRLGLSRDWFDRLVKDEGLEFAGFCLDARSKEAALFEKWFARTKDFVSQCREKNPFPDSENLNFHDRASLSVLRDMINDAEHVPCSGNYTAAFFTAPIHILPYIKREWPSTYKHPIFLTPTELKEWRTIYDIEEQDKESWWFVFQDWNAEWNPDRGSFWLENEEFTVNEGATPLLIVHGLYWGSLAGGHRAELWGIDGNGEAQMVKILSDVTY